MRSVRLAYRDNDRTPVIYCIKAMAERHYAVHVEVVHIEAQQEFEAALFDNSCDVIIEHIEYLHTEAARGKKITFFCAPQIHRGLKLVVPQSFQFRRRASRQDDGGARFGTPAHGHAMATENGARKRR